MKNSRNPMSFVNTITAALLNGAVDEESVIDELERIVQKRKKRFYENNIYINFIGNM